MSLHDDIVQYTRLRIQDAEANHSAFVSPSAIAVSVYGVFASGIEDPHVAYCSIEHCKQIARKELGNRFDAEGTASRAMQGDMFSGQLQEHYPVQTASGQEPQYVRRDLLTIEQLDYNIASLRKSALARIEHANALQAYRDLRADRAA